MVKLHEGGEYTKLILWLEAYRKWKQIILGGTRLESTAINCKIWKYIGFAWKQIWKYGRKLQNIEADWVWKQIQLYYYSCSCHHYLQAKKRVENKQRVACITLPHFAACIRQHTMCTEGSPGICSNQYATNKPCWQFIWYWVLTSAHTTFWVGLG